MCVILFLFINKKRIKIVKIFSNRRIHRPEKENFKFTLKKILSQSTSKSDMLKRLNINQNNGKLTSEFQTIFVVFFFCSLNLANGTIHIYSQSFGKHPYCFCYMCTIF